MVGHDSSQKLFEGFGNLDVAWGLLEGQRVCISGGSFGVFMAGSIGSGDVKGWSLLNRLWYTI